MGVIISELTGRVGFNLRPDQIADIVLNGDP